MIRDSIKKMSPYSPPLEGRSVGDLLLLDFNERTTEIPKAIADEVEGFLLGRTVHRYPEYEESVRELATYLSSLPEHPVISADRVMLTNGSDEGIDVVYRATTEPDDEVIVPLPTFAMLHHAALVQGATVHTPSYTADFQYPFNEVCRLVSEKTKVITVCNPNSPLGTVLDSEQVVALASRFSHVTILVDECYFEFSGVTAAHAVEAHPNLMITRSFSKTWGLAGLRLGYLLGNSGTIAELKKVRGPYSVNTVALVAMRAALNNPSFMREYADEVMKSAKPFFEHFLSEQKIPFVQSRANFILTFPENPQGLEKQLRKNKILVRPRSGPRVDRGLRFSIGTLEQMKRVVEVMEQG